VAVTASPGDPFGRRPAGRACYGRVRDGEVDQDFVMVLAYDDVKRATRDWETFSSNSLGGVPIPHQRAARSVRQLPIKTDPRPRSVTTTSSSSGSPGGVSTNSSRS
jgi:hypothetical protein